MILVSEVLAAIVTFHPGEEAKALCAALRAQGCAVLVIDNASSDSDAILADLAQAGAEVMRNPENQGVAGALAQALDVAAGRGYSWLLTFDQDSSIDDGFLAAMLASSATTKAEVAIIAPTIHDRASGVEIQGVRDAVGWSAVDRVLTSGSLCRVGALHAVGGFRRELFIDFVDWDLCARLRTGTWQIALLAEVEIEHSVGTPQEHHVLGLHVTSTNHSPTRLYYRYRNFVLLAREGRFGVESAWLRRTALSLLATPAKILLLEDAKLHKLQAVAKGILHGWRQHVHSTRR